MRTVTATEKYRAVVEGKLAKSEFVRQMRQQYPMYISPMNGYTDTVQILKSKGMLFELAQDEKAKINTAPNVPIEALERGIRTEAEEACEDVNNLDKPTYYKIRSKVENNLRKDPLYYINRIAGTSSKVDKHDKMTPVKGRSTVDSFNGMKKANLRESTEGYINYDRLIQIADAAGEFVIDAKDEIMELGYYHDDNQIPLWKVKKILAAFDMNLEDLDIPETPETLDTPASHSDIVKNNPITDPSNRLSEHARKQVLKSVVKRIILESLVTEAATVSLAQLKDQIKGVEDIVIPLQKIVTDVEEFLDKTGKDIQKLFDKLGEMEDIQKAQKIAPKIESSFRKDLAPVLKSFPPKVNLPKMQMITIPETEITPEDEKQTIFTPKV